MNKAWTIGQTLDWTTDFFNNAKIPESRIEAEILLSSVLNCPRFNLVLNKNDVIPQDKLENYKRFVTERHKRKPLAYIVGVQEFMGLEFKINNHTLIPRPETELLVEEGIRIINKEKLRTLLEIGTGSGNIAVSIAKFSEISKIYATDLSIEALKICQENSDIHGQSAKIQIKNGDLFNAIQNECLEDRIDIVISNPPYILSEELTSLQPEIGFEPKIALDGGQDGLVFYRRIAEGCRTFLKDNGYLIFELNSGIGRSICGVLEKNKFSIVNIIRDYAGLDRIAVAKKLRD